MPGIEDVEPTLVKVGRQIRDDLSELGPTIHIPLCVLHRAAYGSGLSGLGDLFHVGDVDLRAAGEHVARVAGR